MFKTAEENDGTNSTWSDSMETELGSWKDMETVSLVMVLMGTETDHWAVMLVKLKAVILNFGGGGTEPSIERLAFVLINLERT